MKIGLGADHAGCGLKARIAEHLFAAGHQVTDFGTNDPDKSVDYPVYAGLVGNAVASGAVEIGILICGTGIGMAIAANKVRGVRAAVVHDIATATLAKSHNNANVLTVGARLLAPELAIELVDTFLGAEFEQRHQKRIDLITELECRCGG
jgi:ribose 5-phosphate isomerase B